MRQTTSTLLLGVAMASSAFASDGSRYSEHAPLGTPAVYSVRPTPVPDFTPVKVWDDGHFTYIALREKIRGDLPGVFRLSDAGDSELVNYSWEEANSRFVVYSVGNHFALKLGNVSVVVDRQ